jgi:hypothetical protein
MHGKSLDPEDIRKRMAQVTQDRNTPIDFDGLCAAGILEHIRGNTYKAPDPRSVPSHVWEQAISLGGEVGVPGAILKFKPRKRRDS